MVDLFNTGIRPLIDAHLAQLAEEVRDYGDYWSASSAGYCMRKNMFQRLGIPEVPRESDARKHRVFASGHIFHKWAQDITKAAGLSIAQELELQDEELMIRGHIDDLVLVPNPITPELVREQLKDYEVSNIEITPEQRLILYDYKTAQSKWFEYKRTNDISHYHKMQLGTYMYMLRNGSYNPEGVSTSGKDLTPKTPIEEARILHISKDDLRMAESQLLWDEVLEGEVLSYWTTLNKFWKEKKFPKCECDNYEGGFMAKEKWNPYFYQGEPCSINWYNKNKENK